MATRLRNADHHEVGAGNRMGAKARVAAMVKHNPRLYYLVRMSHLSPLTWRDIAAWRVAGKPAPPPGLVKRRIIRSYAKSFGLKTLVETGTYRGDTVAALLHRFENIYSIELSPVLHKAAIQRFKGAKHAHLICGDSGVELEKIVERLDRPALFWLDGHWCGGQTAKGEADTPILKELTCVLEAADLGHVILVDDARLFGLDPEYPSLEELRALVASMSPGMEFAVDNDIVRVTPPATRRRGRDSNP
jgi:hypothetical protein